MSTEDEKAPALVNDEAGRKPDIGAFDVKDNPKGKGYFNRVGSAWSHKDGRGATVQLDSVPVGGRIVLRELRDQQMQRFDQQHREMQQQPQEHQLERTHEKGRSR